ncbi:MAG: methyltransferase domain-containing protein [Actinomycetota bacterium]|nr:methyltransferase domain-containing protein [Actinomycetota bacterium]
MVAHTHDGIDWTTWLHRLREADAVVEGARRALARRLVGPQTRVVLDVGSGAGGMGVAFAEALSGSGGTVVLVDAVPELLDAATAQVSAAAGPRVEVRAVRADAGSDELLSTLPRADLVFASFVVHHLPDQQAGLDRLAALLTPGGRLAIVESGLEQRCLPWDIGVGEPGLQGRLTAAHGEWFRGLRAGMEGAVRLPVGWGHALRDAGLTEVSSFSYLIDEPEPTEQVRAAAIRWLSGMLEMAAAWIDEADRHTVDQLLDPAGPHYVGGRDDVFLLAAHTVHVGTDRAS